MEMEFDLDAIEKDAYFARISNFDDDNDDDRVESSGTVSGPSRGVSDLDVLDSVERNVYFKRISNPVVDDCFVGPSGKSEPKEGPDMDYGLVEKSAYLNRIANPADERISFHSSENDQEFESGLDMDSGCVEKTVYFMRISNPADDETPLTLNDGENFPERNVAVCQEKSVETLHSETHSTPCLLQNNHLGEIEEESSTGDETSSMKSEKTCSDLFSDCDSTESGEIEEISSRNVLEEDGREVERPSLVPVESHLTPNDVHASEGEVLSDDGLLEQNSVIVVKNNSRILSISPFLERRILSPTEVGVAEATLCSLTEREDIARLQLIDTK